MWYSLNVSFVFNDCVVINALFVDCDALNGLLCGVLFIHKLSVECTVDISFRNWNSTGEESNQEIDASKQSGAHFLWYILEAKRSAAHHGRYHRYKL
jgi:hypothetical protein